jgi:Ran GTPase-activating protein (RanGAP) involved in mRNA processing and transport
MHYVLTDVFRKRELKKAIEELPSDATSLELRGNDLLKTLTVKELIQLLRELPSTITLINVCDDSAYLSPASMITVLSACPFADHCPRIINVVAMIQLGNKCADFSENDLGSKTGDELAAFLDAISSSLTFLNLSDNYLGGLPGSDLAKVLNAIHKGVRILDLSWNNLYSKGGIKLAEAFRCLSGLISLNLSGNHFCGKYIDELIAIFSAIPTSVRQLDLSWNNFYGVAASNLAKAFGALHKDLTVLSLANNHLHVFSETELKEIFAGLPMGLTTLDLRGNGFEQKFGVSSYRLLTLIPPSVTMIIYDDRGYIPRVPPITTSAGKGPGFFAEPPPYYASVAVGCSAEADSSSESSIKLDTEPGPTCVALQN